MRGKESSVRGERREGGRSLSDRSRGKGRRRGHFRGGRQMQFKGWMKGGKVQGF